MALTVMRRLGLTGLATPVVLGGSLLAARDPLLTVGVTERIKAAAPQAAVRITASAPSGMLDEGTSRWCDSVTVLITASRAARRTAGTVESPPIAR